jgi:hypothetical protein
LHLGSIFLRVISGFVFFTGLCYDIYPGRIVFLLFGYTVYIPNTTIVTIPGVNGNNMYKKILPYHVQVRFYAKGTRVYCIYFMFFFARCH